MDNRKIEVKPEELKAVAKKMDAQLDDYKRVYNAIFSEVEGLAKAWKGTDNLAYTNQVQGFKDDFEKMAATLSEYSDFLKRSADTYQATQDSIIAEAKKLVN